MNLATQRLEAFRHGEIGASVVRLELEGQWLSAVRDMLRAAGFELLTRPLIAGRNAAGAPLFRCLDGSSSTDPADPKRVPVEVFVHRDAGFVKVYPLGDPCRRAVPESGVPFAIKGVLFQAPRVRKRGEASWLDADTTFANEAFRVTNDGLPVPKSRRAIYGLKYDARAPHDSYAFAEGVFATTMLRLAGVE
jgi:hypothetical protein